MSLFLVKLPTALAARVEVEPDLLTQIWGEEDVVDSEVAALDEAHKLFEDYLDIAQVVAEGPDRYPWMRKALHGTGEELDVDFGYGPAFMAPPQDVRQVAAGLTGEGWWRPGDEVTTIAQAISAFYTTAAAEDRAIIGIIA
ncbi:hypothetical protein Pro02_69830 [Planobispora rosea]|uniref:Uncharacterized protein n=2 Tax=Planobispora rosea TaxID=35762 RepID=A0A8J3S8B6_PLARO|nr:hypothetical protein Pro02_69830 [Planobispora rosea]